MSTLRVMLITALRMMAVYQITASNRNELHAAGMDNFPTLVGVWKVVANGFKFNPSQEGIKARFVALKKIVPAGLNLKALYNLSRS